MSDLLPSDPNFVPPIPAGVRERRSVELAEIEFRDGGEDGKIEFVGHAAVFETLSNDLGGFVEKIQRGAFRKVLAAGPDVRFLGLNHDPSMPMARTTNNTLELREDGKGLRVYANLAPTQAARDLKVLVQRGDVSQMSFGFRPARPNGAVYGETSDGKLQRTLVDFEKLYDVSPVTFPAYEQTDASVRSLVIAGQEIVAPGGEIDPVELRALTWRIHAGEAAATEEQRQVIDGLLSRLPDPTVSPWVAERCFRAAAREPELLAAIPGQRATVSITDAPSGEPATPPQDGWEWRAAARARDRRLRELA